MSGGGLEGVLVLVGGPPPPSPLIGLGFVVGWFVGGLCFSFFIKKEGFLP